MKRLSLLITLSVVITSCNNLNVVGNQAENEDLRKQNLLNSLEDKGDYYLLEGDIAFHKGDPEAEDFINYLKGSDNSSRGLKLNYARTWKYWGNGVIRYAFIGNVTSKQKSNIRKAISILESVCGVKYEDYTGKVSNYRYIYKVSITGSKTGSSTLGQRITAYAKLASDNRTHVLHEFMHGLGISHEHQRPGADKLVTFYKKNLDGSINADQYEPYDKKYCTTFGDYDYGSIMHYRQDSGGKNVLVAKNGAKLNSGFLTETDKFTLRSLYGPSWEDSRVLAGNFIGYAPDNQEEVIEIQGNLLTLQHNKDKVGYSYTSGDMSFSYTGKTKDKWVFDILNEEYRAIDVEGDGIDEILVTSDSGIGILGTFPMSGKYGLIARYKAKNDTWFGSWRFIARNDGVLAIANFDGEPGDEILVRSPWGIGLLKYENGSFNALVCKPNGTWLKDWKYFKFDNFVSVGDYNGDNKMDFIIESKWGMGILTYDGNDSFESLVTRQYDRWMQNWKYKKGDKIIASGNFDGYGADDFILASDTAVGIFKYNHGSIACIMKKTYNDLPQNLEANTFKFGNSIFENDDPVNGAKMRVNTMKIVSDFNGDGRDELLIESVSYVPGVQYMKDYLFRFDGNTIREVSSGSLKNQGYGIDDYISKPFDYNKNGKPDFVSSQDYPYPDILVFEWDGRKFKKLKKQY